MKLKETISLTGYPTLNGIFEKIYSTTSQPFEWLNEQLSKDLDIEFYLSHSGDKPISPLVKNLRELDETTWLNKVATLIINKFTDKWNKIYTAFIESNYRPLENYDMEQVETPDIHKDSTKKTSTDLKTKTNTDSSNDTYGFNSNSPVPSSDNEMESEVSVTGDKDDNVEEIGETETGTRTLTRHGNIGVTTSQQMLESELKLRSNFNFINMLFNDIDSLMTLDIYQ